MEGFASERYCADGKLGKKHGGKRLSVMGKNKDANNVHIHADFRFIETDFLSHKAVVRHMPELSGSFRDLKRQRYFTDGMLLKSLETTPMFPYISLAFWDVTSLYSSEAREPAIQAEPMTSDQHAGCLQSGCDTSRRECTSTRYGNYEEEETIGREGTTVLPKRPPSDNTIYYVMAFKTQGNSKRLAASWRTWTGAEFVLWKCPEELSLERVSFYTHLVPNTDDVMFILLSECSEGLTNQQAAMHFLERLRDRRCGHVGIYKIDR